jgi:hypothetical protein
MQDQRGQRTLKKFLSMADNIYDVFVHDHGFHVKFVFVIKSQPIMMVKTDTIFAMYVYMMMNMYVLPIGQPK